MRIVLLLIAALMLLNGCQTNSSQNSDQKPSSVKKSYYDDGTLKSELPIENGKANGIAKNYYPSGKLHSKIHYSDGNKSKTIWYYRSGQKYQVTPYKNGQIDGTRKFYRRDQSLEAEVPYRNGEPVEGLREYTTSGTLVKGYPEIAFKQLNRPEDNQVILKVYLSDGSSKVQFYRHIQVNEETVKKQIPGSAGTGRLTFSLSPGYQIKNKQLTIYARTESARGHPYVTHADYTLNAENPK